MQAILIKLLVQAGSQFLLQLVGEGVKKLRAREDNTLGMEAETVKLILDNVEVVNKKTV